MKDMLKKELLLAIEQQCIQTKQQLWFHNILENNMDELIDKIVYVSMGKYIHFFQNNDSPMDHSKYLEYVRSLRVYLRQTFMGQDSSITPENIFQLHGNMLAPFDKTDEDTIKSWKLREEMRNVELIDEHGKLCARDMFISHRKVKTLFMQELHLYNTQIAEMPLQSIIRLFQVNLSKIHPFFNGNGRLFSMLLDVLLIKHHYLPLFLLQDKTAYNRITDRYMIDKNFLRLEIGFLNLVLEKYRDYHIQ